ncbi:hypothetical protein [Rubrivirga sp. IMCC45206]|uniref:hypothetical protein n=1 Tax=Rubrivirga sp. IMCC45206 TaxID=3391614 RepID=UPI0039900F9A
MSDTLPAAAPPPIAPQVVAAEHDLATAVAFRIGRPVDAWSVVAALESEGWRDVDAAAFGRADLFDLGEAIYPACVTEAASAGPSLEAAEARETIPTLARRFSGSYGRGMLYALPVTGQIAALVWLGYSLWASVRLTEGAATMIAMGTIASFIATAGFVQALAHETSRLLGHDLGGQARRVAFRIARLGAGFVASTGALGVLVNLVVPFYPAMLALVGTLYYVLLGWLWLALALLYVEERLWAVAAATTLGILPVWGAVAGLGWNVHLAHALGLAVAIAIALGIATRTLGAGADRDAGDGPEPPLPRVSTVVHTTLPYVAYGILYFAVLFADRVVSWSASGDDPLAYPIWFRTEYELGMDWALAVIFAMLAAVPFSVRRMSGQIHELGGLVDPQAAGAHMAAQYARHLFLLVVIGVVAVALVWAGGLWLGTYGPELLHPIFRAGVTRYVFLIAAAGYFCFSVGLMNGLIFLAQGQTGRVLVPLAWALAVDLAVGLVATRGWGYEHAGWGLLVGAALFAGLTTRHAVRMLRRADYFAYAAY